MSGGCRFSELTKDFSPERRQHVGALKRQRCGCMSCTGHGRVTQRVLAVMLDANQPAVSKLEQKSDAELSSLRSRIEAMERKLKTVAELPQGHVAITNFSPTGEKPNSL